MLKNKFSMLKVLALALSVLMLVSLAACGGKGVAEDDMNAAIQAALSEQAAADASKQAALESSLAAAQAAAESERKAAESSLAAAAAEASRVAAEASKAAASAEKKASEEASKAAASASKAAADASKALEEATRTTTTKATETTAPIVKDDLTAVQTEFAKLKHELVVANADYYLADDYAELALMFDKAAVELQNAQTVAAAESILATLKVEAAAVKNAKTDAAAVQALIAGLGDVETEVVTTVFDKMEEAQDALNQMLFDYQKLFSTKFDDPEDKRADEIESFDVDTVEDMGVDYDALVKANAKILVLKDYIADHLNSYIKALYLKFEDDFDEDGDQLSTKVGSQTAREVIADAYYNYLVLSVINGGDVAAADLEIDWEYLYDEDDGKVLRAGKDSSERHPLTGVQYAEGAKIYNDDAPIAWFTAEEFMEIFATPYLNVVLQETIKKATGDLKKLLDTTNDGYDALTKAATGNIYLADVKDVDLDEIYDEFDAQMEELTFVGNYKGNATLVDAQVDIWTKYVEAYLAAGNAIIEASKLTAEEKYNDQYEDDVDALNEKYEDRTDATSAATLASKLEALAAKKDAFLANVEATPTYTYADLFDTVLLDKYEEEYNEDDIDYDLAAYIKATGVDEEMINYINALISGTINTGFKGTKGTQSGMLGDLVFALTEDLMALRDRLDPTNDESDIYLANTGRLISSMEETAKLEGYVDDKYYENIPAFLELMAKIDATIEAMEAIDESTFEDKDVTLKVPGDSGDDGVYGSKNWKQPIYWQSEAAKEVGLDKYDTQGELEIAINDMLKAEATRLFEEEKVRYEIDKKKDISKITNADLVTLTNTGIPVTYVYTASEQACMEAHTLYNTLYTEVHAKMLELNDLVAVYKDLVTDKKYDAVVTKAGLDSTGILKAEVQEFGALYEGYMDTYSALKYSFSTDAGTNRYVTSFSKSDALDKKGNGIHITNNVDGDADTIVYKYKDVKDADGNVITDANGNALKEISGINYCMGDGYYITNYAVAGADEAVASSVNAVAGVAGNAVNYMSDGVEDDLGEYLKAFRTTFYNDYKETVDADGGITITYSASTVVDLWNYKTAMVQALKDIKASYKNKYVVSTILDSATSSLKEVVKKTPSERFTYDDDATLTASSAAGVAYEAQIDALFDSYIAKIEAVKLNTVAQVKNVKGTEILKKYDKKTLDHNGDGSISGATETIEKVTFNYAVAKSIVDAYAIDLVGKTVATEELGVVLGSSVKTVTGQSGYDIKDTNDESRIKNAWTIYYKGEIQ